EFADQNNRAAWPRLEQKAQAIFRTRTRDEWCAVLEGTDACFAPVLGLAEAPAHRHLSARNTFLRYDDVVQPAPAPRFSRTPSATPSVAAVLSAWAPPGARFAPEG